MILKIFRGSLFLIELHFLSCFICLKYETDWRRNIWWLISNLSQKLTLTTREILRESKKKPHPFVAKWKRHKKSIQNFFVQLILKIFEFSFILDQSQVCISNRLGDRACQSEPLFCKNAHFSIGLQNWKWQCFYSFLCHF